MYCCAKTLSPLKGVRETFLANLYRQPQLNYFLWPFELDTSPSREKTIYLQHLVVY